MTRMIAGQVPAQRDRLSSVIADRGIPRIAAEVVHRPRLIEALDRLLPLTVLRAPYGFGKTTLAAQWVLGLGTEPVWVSVDRTGMSAEQFWARLARALPGPAGTTPEEALEQSLAGPGRPIVVVVDDIDRVVDSPVVANDLLDHLRRYPRLHLVATTNADVLDHRAWLDLDGQILGPDELAFTSEEAAEVLANLGTAVGELDVVTEQLGGWPLAVRAYALARARALDLGIDDALRTVKDQLSATLLAQFDESVLDEVVLPTAVIGDFSLDELPVLLDRPEAELDLEHLLALGFLTVDNSSSRRYRWPDLLREVVIDLSTAASRNRVRALHRDLAARYASLESHGPAMVHAAAAEDWPWLRDYIESRWTRVFSDHFDLLGELITTAPPGALGDGVLIQALLAFYAPDMLRIKSLRAHLPVDPDDVERLVHELEPTALYDQIVALLGTIRTSGNLEAAIEVAGKVPAIVQATFAAHPNDLVSPGAAVSFQCAMVWLQAGRIRQAIAELERAHRYGARSIIGHMLRDSAAKLALVHGYLGEHPQARTWVGRAEAAPDQEIWAKPFIESALTAAKVLNAASVLDRRTAVVASAELAMHHPRDELWVLLHYARSKVALLWGNPAAALRELDAAESTGVPKTSAFMADILLAARIDLAMKRGLGSRCAALLADASSNAPVLGVRRARLALLCGDPALAVELTTAVLDHPDANPSSDLDALVIEAVSRHRLGDADAPTRLSEAFAVAGRRIDSFALVPRDDLLALGRQVPGAHAVLADPRLLAVGEVFPERLAVISLTDRERVVLRHLAQGLTLPGIAVRETVSINTVKSQVRSLYQKLEATGREQALQIAAKEGLV